VRSACLTTASALAASLALAACGGSSSSGPSRVPATVRTVGLAPARGPIHTPGPVPHGKPLVELLRIGLNEATRDRVRVFANRTAVVLLGHGGGGQAVAELAYTRPGFARLRRILGRTSMTRPGRAGPNPGLRGGGIYLYVFSYRGRQVRGIRNAEPPHVRAAIRALDELADGGGPVRKMDDRRTGPAPND
jgi:hypothetical protein